MIAIRQKIIKTLFTSIIHCFKYCSFYCSLFIVHCLYCSLFIVYCLLFIVYFYCLLYCLYCLLFSFIVHFIVECQYCRHCYNIVRIVGLGKFSDVEFVANSRVHSLVVHLLLLLLLRLLLLPRLEPQHLILIVSSMTNKMITRQDAYLL
jgi:hypothetical protein